MKGHSRDSITGINEQRNRGRGTGKGGTGLYTLILMQLDQRLFDKAGVITAGRGDGMVIEWIRREEGIRETLTVASGE